ncbi:hypothetical protein GF342_03910 [Candidatus Woesearchaeota archaeon]|nr:hypothetical protein [Candidatus Woesearchaeota archaeon]
MCEHMISTIAAPTTDPVLNLALDTVRQGKQALVFVNTKRSAEKVAEEISKRIEGKAYNALAEKVLGALSKPTKQCKRLAAIIKKGVAFHHAGLASAQKHLIEDTFREGKVSIICCTPTLAAGLNLPAYRAIIRDLKRYAGRFGMRFIPVLEYHQMAGRAGRPGYDDHGEAIIVATAQAEADDIYDEYICGEPENIQSKLNVEPVMRTYLLSLISSKIIQTDDQILDFFKDTFWAYQYEDMARLEDTIYKTLSVLLKWQFLLEQDGKYRATAIGHRVAQLYLDPLTAHHIVKGIKRSPTVALRPVSFIQLVCHTNEMWPLLSVKSKEYELVQQKVVEWENQLLDKEPSMFELDYEDWLKSIKTSLLFLDWIDEHSENYLLETYNVRPGELKAKLDKAEWLLYGMSELSILLDRHDLVSHISKVRIRLKNGVREELLPLLKLKGVGRVRARQLFRHGIKIPSDLIKAKATLPRLLGPKIAKNLLSQLGHEMDTNTGRLADFT